jgi:RNA polymerase sigma-70 factor (ECF subfamily)
VLAQLEEMTGPEIAEALELPLSNVYSRIESAQKAFDRALKRHRARQRGAR